MIGALARATFSLLAGSSLLKKAASRYGLRRTGGIARRFVAGETAAEAIAAVRQLEARGLLATIDLLGESVTSSEQAVAAAREYVALIETAAAAGVASRSLSVKLTQIGLAVDRATAIDNLRRIVDAGVEPGFFVRVDMEGSAWTENTLDTVETLWSIGYRNVGVAIQAALRRSPADVERLNALGMSIRLVKGAYREPRGVAHRRREDVERAFAELMETLLVGGHRPAIATHDPRLIERTRQLADARGIARDAFEFELLYGIRRDLQHSLVRDGYQVRVYLPYGTEWYPYFMRRLGERPANVAFVLKSLVSEESVP